MTVAVSFLSECCGQKANFLKLKFKGGPKCGDDKSK